jgi:Abortive infection alpha
VGDSLIPISDDQAKLGQELVAAIRNFGGWLADFLGDIPKDLAGLIFGDKLKVQRVENLFRIWEKAKERLSEQGIEVPGPVNRKLALPILAAAADENSDELQDLWARLLAAAMNPDQSKQGRLGFIDALKTLDPLDARVLKRFRNYGTLKIEGRDEIAEGLGVSPDQVDLSLQNLFKANFLGPRNPNLNLSAFQIPTDMVLTPFGREFLRVVLD